MEFETKWVLKEEPYDWILSKQKTLPVESLSLHTITVNVILPLNNTQNTRVLNY